MTNSKTTFPFKKEKGPNGLTMIHVPMKNTKTVTILVLVGVGSRYETKDINGISHFLEHMMFKGTEKRPTSLDISQELDSVGAAYNAFTDKEVTGYWVKIDASHAELAVDVVSDIFLNSTIPAEEIEKERGVVMGEIDMYEDNPRWKTSELFDELLYPNHPVGWSIAGPKKVIKNLKKEDFLSHREKFYRAKNAVVVIAGNITSTKVKKFVKEYFKTAPRGKTQKPLSIKEKQAGPKSKTKYKKTDQTHIVLGVRSFNSSDPRRWPLSLLTVILGGNMSSRLFTKIREELGLGYYVRAGNLMATDHGYFEVSLGVHNNRSGEAIGAVLEELRRIKRETVGDKEIKKAREYVRGSTLIGLESSNSLGTYYGEQQLLEKKILTPEQKFRMISRVTPADVKRVARDIFQPKKLNLALIGPHRDGKKFQRLLKL